MIQLRPYQQRAKDRARARIAARIKRLLVVAPTGAGKTVLFTSIVQSAVGRGSRVLILAHRRELIKQPFCKFVRAGLDPAQIGVVLAGVSATASLFHTSALAGDDDALWHHVARHRPNALVQVASIDSIRNRTKPPADLIIIDEAHRSLSASYVKLADEYPNAIIIGLTATPIRADNKPLGDFFEDLIVVATYRELVAEGYLMEPRVWTVPAAELPDLSRVRIKGGDYDEDQLSQACDQQGLVGSITDHWQRLAGGLPTFCFGVNRNHSAHIAERFREAGVPALHIDAETPSGQRDKAFSDLRSGALKVLCNVDVATEGVDVPCVACVVLARPTKSLRVFLQQVGRGSRPAAGKQSFLILDHAGCVLDHGLPHMIEFTPEVLHSPKSKSAVTSAPARSCPKCLAVLPASMPVCPDCGHEFVAAPRGALEEHEGELVEVVAPSEEDLRTSWTQLCADCLAGGYKPGWVHARWAETYPGTRPPEGCVPPTLEQCSERKSQRADILDGYLQTAIEKGHKMGWVKASFKAADGQWPSVDLFQKTQTAEMVRWLMIGWAALKAAIERPVSEPAPVVVAPVKVPPVKVAAPVVVTEQVAANDVELVEYAL